MNTATLNRIAILATADLSAAEVALRKIPNDDPNGCFLPHVLDGVRRGESCLAEIVVNGKRCGFTVYRIEEMGPDYNEFVSIATITNPKFGALRYELDSVLCELARQNKCKSLRMHTARHGLVLEAIKNGWHVPEITLRKNL